MAQPKKMLVTFWTRENGTWRKVKMLYELKSNLVVLDLDMICGEDTHIKQVEFIY